MKKYLLIAAALAVGLAAAAVLATQSGPKSLNVSEVGADPAAFTGAIAVTGIIGGISQQDPSIFGIMDLKELQCKTANCNKLLIPVRFQGKQPILGDEVKITGKFVNPGDGYLFVAEKLKIVRNHKIGG